MRNSVTEPNCCPHRNVFVHDIAKEDTDYASFSLEIIHKWIRTNSSSTLWNVWRKFPKKIFSLSCIVHEILIILNPEN